MDRPQLIFVWLLRPNDLNSRIMRFKKKNATLSVSNMNQLWLITENRLIISCKSMKGFRCYQSIDARDSPTKRATITVIRFFFVHLPNIFPQIIPFETECSWFHQNAIELVIDFIPAFDWFDCNSQRTIQSSWFFRCFKTCRRGCRRSKKRYTVEIERDKIDMWARARRPLMDAALCISLGTRGPPNQRRWIYQLRPSRNCNSRCIADYHRCHQPLHIHFFDYIYIPTFQFKKICTRFR